MSVPSYSCHEKDCLLALPAFGSEYVVLFLGGKQNSDTALGLQERSLPILGIGTIPPRPQNIELRYHKRKPLNLYLPHQAIPIPVPISSPRFVNWLCLGARSCQGAISLFPQAVESAEQSCCAATWLAAVRPR
jgi:hypothetical protein